MQLAELSKCTGTESLIKEGDRIVCLVSGGVDSMVLLELLYRQARETSHDLTVLHFNYHLRGEESDRDCAFVRQEAACRQVPMMVVDAPLRGKSGIQERARTLRRKRTVELALECGWNVVAMGHQADDQLETLLMRMIRGAGQRGLRGMDGETEMAPGLRLIRPLLGISRRSILHFARREGIGFVEDSSNGGGRYLRNRIRHILVPGLKRENRSLAEDVAAACAAYRAQFDEDRKEATDFLARHLRAVPLGRYFQLKESVRFLVLEDLLKKNGFGKEVNRCHVTEIEALLHRPGRTRRSYGKASLLVEEGGFVFSQNPD